MSDRVYNFSAGPAALPLEVLEKAASEMTDFDNSGMSVIEMSHRSASYSEVHTRAIADIKELLKVPDTHEVLLLQGGASLQFAMVPMNLCLEGRPVNLINTGSWTKKALKEIKKLHEVEISATTEEDNFLKLPSEDEIKINRNASYVHIASNNTIFGTQFKKFPETGDVPLVADMSSDILSRPVDVSKFGLIFAGAQKNIGPSGVTLVIVRKDLAERAPESLPTMLQYRTHIEANSLYNTPPTFAIYMVSLVTAWLKEKGGLDSMQKINSDKAVRLYKAIDDTDFYYCPVQQNDRSDMNVVFRITGDKEELEKKFVTEATAAGLTNLKGHRSVGGLRASIYNAMTTHGVEQLISFMLDFAEKNK